jgi:DNA-directed RNA polymerase subunit M/transcription elongation factor TFIIS
MPNKDENKLILELKPCSRCGNPFMVKKGQNLTELVCDNCIKLDQRKRDLQIGVFNKVIEVENQMEDSIREMTNSLSISKGQFNKQFFLDKIKKRAEILTKSIELIEKIEETNDEKYINDYLDLFEKIKEE